MPMTTETYLEAIRRESEAFAAAAAGGRLDAQVAACPEWTQADLVWHLGEVHRFWTFVAGTQASTPDGYEPPARPAEEDLVAWFRDGADRLRAVLAATDPDARVWTWTGEQGTSWIVRRMAQETAVHRWDAERAAGAPQPIAAELAVDGIDEFLTWFLEPPGGGPGGSIHIHAGDAPGEWWIAAAGDGWTVEREHRKGDVALRGAASDLLLALWRRVERPDLDVIGDEGVADRFLGHADLR